MKVLVDIITEDIRGRFREKYEVKRENILKPVINLFVGRGEDDNELSIGLRKIFRSFFSLLKPKLIYYGKR